MVRAFNSVVHCSGRLTTASSAEVKVNDQQSSQRLSTEGRIGDSQNWEQPKAVYQRTNINLSPRGEGARHPQLPSSISKRLSYLPCENKAMQQTQRRIRMSRNREDKKNEAGLINLRRILNIFQRMLPNVLFSVTINFTIKLEIILHL